MDQIFEAHRAELERQAMLRRRQAIEDFFDNLEFNDEGKPVINFDDEGNPILPLDEDGNPLLYLHSDGMLREEEEEIIEEVEEEPEEEEQPPEPEEPPINREEILAEIQKEGDEILANAKAEADKILEEANAELERLKEEIQSQAMQEAEELKEQAREEGRASGQEEGYQSGFEQGQEEAARKVEEENDARIAEIEADYNNKVAQLAQENERDREDFRQKEETMERQMADVFCDIIDKVFAIEFSDKKEIILHLVDNVITNTPGSKEYLIRVNDANFDIVHENKASLIEKIGSGVELDIIKDPLLSVEECQIETDGGVYDCGMDIQFSNLIKDLRALSLV